MEDPADMTAIAAALHDPANDTSNQDVHLIPQAEASQNQESVPYGVADIPRWPEPADPANPGGGIQPLCCPAGPPLMRASRVRKARRPGTCPLCDAPVSTGQQIGLVDGHGWCHTTCIIAVQQRNAAYARNA